MYASKPPTTCMTSSNPLRIAIEIVIRLPDAKYPNTGDVIGPLVSLTGFE